MGIAPLQGNILYSFKISGNCIEPMFSYLHR